MSRLARRPWIPLAALMLGLSLSGCKPKTAERPTSPLEQAKLLPAFDPGTAGSGEGNELLASRAMMARPPEVPKIVPAELLDYGPEGDTDEYPTIQFVFSQPMVAFGDDDARTDIDPNFSFEIEPAVEGRLKWVSPHRLEFVPYHGLPRAQGYEVHASGTLADTNGHAVEMDKVFEFATPRPKLQITLESDQYYGGSMPVVHWKSKMLVTSWWKFSSKAVQNKLRAFAVDSLGNRTPVAIKTRSLTKKEKKRRGYGPRHLAIEVSPKTHWPANREVVVEVDGALKSREGPLPLGSPERLGVMTMAGLQILGIDCFGASYADGCEVGPVRVRFGTPVRANQIAKLESPDKIRGFEVRPEGEWWDYYGDYDQRRRGWYDSAIVWGDFKHGQTITLQLEGAKDVYGQPQVEDFEDSIHLVEPAPELGLGPGIGTLTPERALDVGYNSRHIESVAVKMTPLPDEQFVRYDRRMRDGKWPGWPEDDDETVTKIIKLDHQGSYGWSSQKLDLRTIFKQPSGPVLVEVSAQSLLPRADGRAMPAPRRSVYQLSNLNVSGYLSLPRQVVMVTEGIDNKPVQGATVELLDFDAERLGKALETDVDGVAELPPHYEHFTSKWIRVTKGGDTRLAWLPDVAQSGHSYPGGELRPGESVLSSVTLERGVYRPGEKIYALGYAAVASVYEDSGLRPLPKGSKVLLTLTDNRGEEVAQRSVHAKASGKFWATLRIPKTGSLGTYQVTATVLDGSSSVSAKVKEFRTPEFEVEATVDKADVHHGESVELSANANYYFGGAVPFTSAALATECSMTHYRPPGLPGHWYSGAGEWPRRGWGRGRQPRVRLGGSSDDRPGHLETTITRAEDTTRSPTRAPRASASAT